MTRYLTLGKTQLPFYDALTGLRVGIGEVVEISLSITSYNIEKALLTQQLVYATLTDYTSYLSGGYTPTTTLLPMTSPAKGPRSFSKGFSKGFN